VPGARRHIQGGVIGAGLQQFDHPIQGSRVVVGSAGSVVTGRPPKILLNLPQVLHIDSQVFVPAFLITLGVYISQDLKIYVKF
jgi:hypothetical protein